MASVLFAMKIVNFIRLTGDGSEPQKNRMRLLSASSRHSGGANIVKFDGSRAFISQTIYYGNA